MEKGRIELQKLFNFVADAFPKDSVKLYEAGKGDYENARKVPSRMLLLLEGAKDFADTNSAKLAGVGYTAAMAGILGATQTDLDKAVNAKSKAQRERPSKTRERRKILNDMYDTVRDLCEDAKIIYVNNYAMYNLFLIPGVDKGSSVSGKVNAGKTVNALHQAFHFTVQLKLKNTGEALLRFCLAPSASVTCSEGITVASGTSQSVNASELGDVSNAFLNVTNLDPATEGSYSVAM